MNKEKIIDFFKRNQINYLHSISLLKTEIETADNYANEQKKKLKEIENDYNEFLEIAKFIGSQIK